MSNIHLDIMRNADHKMRIVLINIIAISSKLFVRDQESNETRK